MTNVQRRILVADDDPTARLLMQATLEKAGFAVTCAQDGEEAVQRFAEHPFDLVMLDADMPRLDGFGACAALRRQAGEVLPIMMVTGMEDSASVEASYQAGATDFIAKPINWALIGHRVRYLLRTAQAAHALRAANARHAGMLDAIPDTLLRIQGEDCIVEARAGNTEGGAPLDIVSGQSLSAAFSADVGQRLRDAIRAARETARPQTIDFARPAADGSTRHHEARLVTIEDDEALCLLRDITERKDNEDRIFRLAYIDSLTGLANRQSFIERLERDIRRARLSARRIAILFLDLDRFKSVNDTLGHDAGDSLLREAARRLREAVRPSDLVARSEVEFARLGGDEFTVLLPDIGRTDDALQVAERIRERMLEPFVLDGSTLSLTTSIGIAVFPDDGQDAGTLLKHADTAMYHAKDQGRNNCRYYSAELTAEAMRRMQLESSLLRALARNEFRLAYQPKVDTRSGRVASVEALVRWQHPERGLVMPLEFIPFAEENGLISAIGRWVLQHACREAATWLQAGRPLRLAVNLSPLQLREPNIAATVRSALDEAGLPPEWLEIEVTEGALMDDSESTLGTLLALRAQGIHLALDDFGTGYSSLSYLKRLPLSTLKVDRSFVTGLPDDIDNLAIVQAIVSLAKHLGFSITAEGVETFEQACLLKRLGSNDLQGYYFSRPVDATELDALLACEWTFDRQTPPNGSELSNLYDRPDALLPFASTHDARDSR
ncbi:MAG TPA: EAL domain-containing protein [Thauera sp.]|uniref:putative bifunctional diguanylate cyclase/phosphodiesterase n=1 Tax=Thauera sp. TaxID=1905334 RepID=UPI002D07263A|nr:EAL domain-containing protein [Thauera sp.]HRP24255.1 EAL domain-containing protein [Thauera sp.]HRP66846.1 EAL domain-containing protein [Thauera sp.]